MRLTAAPRQGVAAIAVTLALVPVAAAHAAAGRREGPVALVALQDAHVAHRGPSPDAPRLMTVAGRRPLTGVRTMLPLLGTRVAAGGGTWLRVALPGRPNSGTGWITANRTWRRSTRWRIAVSLRARTVTVFARGRQVRHFRAVVGAAATPTPTGRFFVEEPMSLSPRAAGAPFALATSARSDVLQEFDGGPGQIALHGVRYLAGALGTASSHGCIRVSDHAITWLAERMRPGVPLTIRR